MWHRLKLLLVVVLVGSASSEEAPSSPRALPEPRTVTYCELAKDPAAFNHELIRITGFVTHGFEDFQLAEPVCPPLAHEFSLWLMYGGKVESGTIYCCPGEGDERTRRKTLRIEGIEVPLATDAVFRRFRALLKKEPDTTVRATLVGYFFSGTKQDFGEGPWWGGAGHLGCCSLLAIQRVEAFEPHARNDVDYTAEAGYYEEAGCSWHEMAHKRLVSITSGDDAGPAIEEQKLADSGERPWAFVDPDRVALESLQSLYRGEKPVLKRVRQSPVRQVYHWQRWEKASVVVVVTRPYWLSFYANSNSVAWVSTTIKESQCY